MSQESHALDTARCETCGAAIPADAPFEQCPACLLDWAADPAGAESDALAALPALPRLFGDYELLRQIGCGGMGIVYEARHLRLKRRVALKMIRPDLASKRFLRRFLIEGEAAARLDHPNIIPIYEIKEDGSESFLSMQFIEGETLKEKIRQGQLGLRKSEAKPAPGELRRREQALARLMADTALGVHHAHERGVFHRDLKPGNIIVDAQGQPHIADFGVAKVVQQDGREDAESTLTVPGATLGTPEYMAPEQASGSGLVDTAAIAATDVYSLGAILYELLTGRPPFRGQSHLETLQKVREADLKRPRSLNPAVSRDLETICLKCLERNPKARYASAAAVADDLTRFLEGKSIAARPASPPVRVQRWVKKNPLGAALIASLGLILGIVSTLLVVLADRMRTAEINKGNERMVLFQPINDWWALPELTNITIPSSPLLAAIRDQKPRPFVEGRDLSLQFGMSVDQNPITRAHSVAGFLGELEQKMEQELGRAVFIDLHMSKALRLDSELLSTREADIQRLDALTYVQARALDAGIRPLVLENDADEIVFCVLQDSPIRTLQDLAGKSVGFGDTNSAVTVLAQYCLLTNGLRRSDLRIKYFNTLSYVSKTNLPQFGSAEIVTDMREVKGGREAVRHLLDREVDAAVTLKRYFEVRRHRGPGLRIISRMAGLPEVFAGRSGLEPATLNAFRDAMLSLKESPGLGTLSSFRTVTGVVAADDSSFDGLRAAFREVRERFEVPPQRP